MGVKMIVHDSLHQKLSDTRIRNALHKALKQTMYDLLKEAMKETPVDTGNLRRSHSVDMRLGSDAIEGLLRNSAEYWTYVNFGTSRQDPANFIGKAFDKVQPAKKVKEYFNEFGGNG